VLKLAGYYNPLNAKILLIFIFSLFFFDSLGTLILKKILSVKNDESRLINWLVGFGAFIFLWFVLMFFIAPQSTPIIISVIVLSLISFPNYFKNKEYLVILRELWKQKLAIFVILPFLPSVFVKASLPPYYGDEMGYHFLSPFDAKNIGRWAFNGGIYQNAPRLLDIAMVQSFIVAKTYSLFRILHFSILATSMLYAYRVLRKNFGLLSGLFFVFFFFSIPQDIVLVSTLGYVDVAAFSLLLIGYLGILEFVLYKKKEMLFTAAIFWGMALGTKYTPLTALAALAVPLAYLVIRERKVFGKILRPGNLLIAAGLVMAFGGYWYLKNLIVYGNPTYPFIFPCKRFASEWCGAAAQFFSGWTTKVNLANFKLIIDAMFPRSVALQWAIGLSPLLALLSKNRKIRLISLIISTAVIVEILILKKTSGFYIRYHQHIQILLLLLVSIQFGNSYWRKLVKFLAGALFLLVMIYTIRNYVYTVAYSNSLKFLNWSEIYYSVGKMDIYGWVKERFPRVIKGLEWCENPPSGKQTPLARFDPDMIWNDEDGFIRVFYTNCYFENPPLDDISLENALDIMKKGKMKFWTITPKQCLPQSEIAMRPLYDNEHSLYLRRLNNIIVCNSRQVAPSLYYFDYETLKEN
jgi:hypothetical protein